MEFCGKTFCAIILLILHSTFADYDTKLRASNYPARKCIVKMYTNLKNFGSFE